MRQSRSMKQPASPKLNILVVDDEPLVCDAVKMLLTFEGHEVETAPNARRALELYAPGKYQLVVLDYEMPGVKGDQLAAEIKQRMPTQPILMLTAYGELLRSPGKPMAAVDLIVDKPFRLEHLREAVAKVIGRYRDPQT